MGLDALDLVFRLEKRFGIKIDRNEAFAVVFDTAGTIHRYLVAKLQGEYQKAPRMEPLFQEVVKAVNQITGRWKLTSSFNLNKRFSPPNRKANWESLEKALGISLPKLEQPANEEFPRISRQYESLVSLTYWIIENYPNRAEWFPVSCERTGKMAARQWNEDEIWSILCECIRDALGVKIDEVTRESRMIEDLGME